MKKYYISLHGNPFYGIKYTHTKSGMSYYYDFITTLKQGAYETLLEFPSEREAKLWMLSKSSMQNTKHFMYALACAPDSKLDELIAKGKYKLSKTMMRKCDIDPTNSDTRISSVRANYPLLCEFVITEYEYVDSPKN